MQQSSTVWTDRSSLDGAKKKESSKSLEANEGDCLEAAESLLVRS